MSITPVAWLAGFGGVYLVWSAIADRNPIEDLRSGLTGRPVAPAKSPGSGLAGGGQTGPGVPSADLVTGPLVAGPPAPGSVVPKSATVAITTPRNTIYLVPDAARAFRAWEAGFGSSIPCGEGWRDCAAADRAAAKEPKRFAPCATSYHTKGRAVDVDNDWLSRLPAASQSKLRTAAKAAGWAQARWKGEASCGTNTSNDNEPWHFSYGGCG